MAAPRPSARAATRRPARARGPAPGALAQAFAAAAQRLAAVLGGSSLAALPLGDAPAALRPAIHELLYGTLRRHGEGDAILARLVDRPLDRPLRALLLVALYRLVAAPDDVHTSVDQAVDAAPLAGCGRAGGLVNAVLRNFLRRREVLLADVRCDDAIVALHPAWWLARLRAAYPQDWPAIVAADNAQPPITLRINARRQGVDGALAAFAAAGIATTPLGDGWPQALRVESPGRIERLPGYAEGHFSVQDPGAQRAAFLLAPRAGDRVLDACAAPGGKTAHLLETADLDLTALDFDAARAARIGDTLDRLGLSARVLVGDAGDPVSWWDGRPYDRILADVPCTASGVVRRHPDAKWLRRDTDVAGFAAQQARLLDALWPLLAPGGRLLYATCSVFPEENDVRVDAFASAHSGVRVVGRERWLPGPLHDGFYYALLEKA